MSIFINEKKEKKEGKGGRGRGRGRGKAEVIGDPLFLETHPCLKPS